MSYNITLIPGDGIGPELTEATRRVLEATGVSPSRCPEEVRHAAAGTHYRVNQEEPGGA
jgi:isocitrate/isopropylmalate dehydrogenase